jgi:hypothetical protein
MREERTTDEELTDEVLILALYHLAQVEAKAPEVGDRLKAMKLVFLANHSMLQRRAKGLNCTFYRWNYGPLSNDVYVAWTRLIQAGLLQEEERISVTPRGSDLASAFIDEVLADEGNRMFLQFLQSTAQDWARKSSRSILNAVYAMEVAPVGGRTPVKVRDLPLSARVTKILEQSEARSALNVPDGWLETLGLMLNPPAMESIIRAADDARAGRVVLGDDIWAEFESSTV